MSAKTLNHAAAVKRLEALFNDTKIDENPKRTPTPEIHVEIDTKLSTKCDVHGKNGSRKGSLGNILHITTKRDSLGNILSQKKEQSFPGYFGNNGHSMGPRRESMPALNNNNGYYGYHR